MTDAREITDKWYFSEFCEWFESQHDCIPMLDTDYEKGAYEVWELLYCPQVEKPSWSYIGKMRELINSQRTALAARDAELQTMVDESLKHDEYARSLQDENARLHKHICKQDAEIERLNLQIKAAKSVIKDITGQDIDSVALVKRCT